MGNVGILSRCRHVPTVRAPGRQSQGHRVGNVDGGCLFNNRPSSKGRAYICISNVRLHSAGAGVGVGGGFDG